MTGDCSLLVELLPSLNNVVILQLYIIEKLESSNLIVSQSDVFRIKDDDIL